MKRIFSVWMTAARTILWKLLLIVIVMAAVETVLFWQALHTDLLQSVFYNPYGDGFGSVVTASHLQQAFGVAVGALCIALCLQGSQLSGARTGYTLQRLPLREETVTLLWAVFHAGCLMILWACQLAIVFSLWLLYNRYGLSVSGQDLELFLSFYCSGVLHSLLPLADVTQHLRNLCWILSLGFHTAAFGYFQRRDRFRGQLPVLMLLLAVGCGLFATGMNHPYINLSVAALWLALIVFTIYRIRGMRYETD